MASDVWDVLAPVGGFFENVGTEYVSGGTNPPSGSFAPGGELFSLSQTPVTTDVIFGVRYGWPLETILGFWGPFFTVALFFSLMVLTGVLYCAIRVLQIRREERLALVKVVHPIAAYDVSRTQIKWNHIMEEMQSDDERKWRLAILEADILLNELLDVLGYKGETMAEKMKQVDVSEFNTIDFAWEAHKIRNRVAHEGMDHPLTDREARRVIRMYERVFREFRYIE